MSHERMIPQIEGMRTIGRKGPYFFIMDETNQSIGEYLLSSDGELQWKRNVTMEELQGM